MTKRAEQDARHLAVVGSYYQTGDEQALGPMLAELRELALAYLRGRLRVLDTEQAEDITQEALTQLLGHFRARRYQPVRPPGVLLCVLCRYRHLGRKYDRASAPGRHEDPFLLISSSHATAAEELPIRTEEEAQAATTVVAATQAVLSLDPNARAAVVLHYYQGLTPAAAAQQLGVNEATFRERLRRGLSALREWATTAARPGPEVYAALPRLDTGSLFTEPLRLAG